MRLDGIEPPSADWKSGVLPLNYRRNYQFKVAPEGVEPTPVGLKVRYASVNTTEPAEETGIEPAGRFNRPTA